MKYNNIIGATVLTGIFLALMFFQEDTGLLQGGNISDSIGGAGGAFMVFAMVALFFEGIIYLMYQKFSLLRFSIFVFVLFFWIKILT